MSVSEKAFNVFSVVVFGAFLSICIVGWFNFTSALVEANQDRTFGASVIGVQTTQHDKVDCPQLNEFQPTTAVLRIQLDHPVVIWSENGTGRGEKFVSNYIDLRTNTQIDLEAIAGLVGKDSRTFHYSASFLSVCDRQRIPVISRFAFR